MDEVFESERKGNLMNQEQDEGLKQISNRFINRSACHKYTYNFDVFGLPLIQFPQDIVSMQEIIWKTKPDLIIETGVARGGSVVMWAAMLKLLGEGGQVIGIDRDIREGNRSAIEQHPFADRIDLVEADSVDPETLKRVSKAVQNKQRVMVILDSNHTHDHVLAELRAYGPLVTAGCYLVVCDTIIAFADEGLFVEKPWSVDDNPLTAIQHFLTESGDFQIDEEIDARLLISSSPQGYLKCVRD